MKRLPYETFQNIMQFSGNCFILRVIASGFYEIINFKINKNGTD